MIPIIKGWLTERSLEITSNAIQIHGGMGFIEETGIAQHYRDARILPYTREQLQFKQMI